MISLDTRGDWSNTLNFFDKMLRQDYISAVEAQAATAPTTPTRPHRPEGEKMIIVRTKAPVDGVTVDGDGAS